MSLFSDALQYALIGGISKDDSFPFAAFYYQYSVEPSVVQNNCEYEPVN